jgi:hypothetical protein
MNRPTQAGEGLMPEPLMQDELAAIERVEKASVGPGYFGSLRTDDLRIVTKLARAAVAAHDLTVGEMLDILADVECALMMTREHSSTVTVTSFVDSSTQFRQLADFLHSKQHAALTSKGE